MRSKEYQILTGQHRDEELFSETKIQELLSVSCCHQKQHLLNSVACNTMTYNFSTKEAKNSSEDQKCQLKVLDSVGSFKDLSKLSSTLQHLLTTSD